MEPQTASRSPRLLRLSGAPSGAATWRRLVAEQSPGLVVARSLGLDFVLPPGRWVDLDTLVESTAAGLRDARVLAPRFAGLDGVVATKTFGSSPGVRIRGLSPSGLQAPPPGVVALDVCSEALPRANQRDTKQAWRAIIASGWSGAPALTGSVWAEVTLATAGSLLGPLEVVLDALEPVLGRDPRGRDWQEFFPNDDRIEWLRVRRDRTGGAVRLRLGPRG